jgi:hypothetical protein
MTCDGYQSPSHPESLLSLPLYQILGVLHEICRVFDHTNEQCPKRVSEVSPTNDVNDGFTEVTRKGGKGKQKVKTNPPIYGVRLSKPQPKFVCRTKTKSVDTEASTSTANNGKSVEHGKSVEMGNTSAGNNGKSGAVTKGSSVMEENAKSSKDYMTKPKGTNVDDLSFLSLRNSFASLREENNIFENNYVRESNAYYVLNVPNLENETDCEDVEELECGADW